MEFGVIDRPIQELQGSRCDPGQSVELLTAAIQKEEEEVIVSGRRRIEDPNLQFRFPHTYIHTEGSERKGFPKGSYASP